MSVLMVQLLFKHPTMALDDETSPFAGSPRGDRRTSFLLRFRCFLYRRASFLYSSLSRRYLFESFFSCPFLTFQTVYWLVQWYQ